GNRHRQNLLASRHSPRQAGTRRISAHAPAPRRTEPPPGPRLAAFCGTRSRTRYAGGGTIQGIRLLQTVAKGRNEMNNPDLPIYTIRKLPVVLDSDLAKAYGVETKVFNQAFKRNSKRFPPEFAFQLTDE